MTARKRRQRFPTMLGAVSLLVIGGCSQQAVPANDVDIANAADAARGSVESYGERPDETVAPRPAPVPSPAPIPTSRPTPESAPTATDESDVTAPAAVAVVRRYYDLIAARRYGQAWRLWGDAGRASEMSEQAFAASFVKYADYRAEIGAPGRIGAGAGQRYVTVPVRIAGRLKDGDRPFAMEGPVTLHRTADIDGATREQRRWRISASGVRPRPGEAAPAPVSDAATVDRATATYRCDDGTQFVADFDNRADTATLRFGPDGSVRLQGQRPASGIWYRNARYELRGKGRDATLTRGRAMPVSCRSIR